MEIQTSILWSINIFLYSGGDTTLYLACTLSQIVQILMGYNDQNILEMGQQISNFSAVALLSYILIEMVLQEAKSS